MKHVWSRCEACVKLQILCDPRIQRKFNETYTKKFCAFYCKLSCMETERHKCYFNVFSPSIHLDKYYRKKSFFSKLHDKCQNWQNPWLFSPNSVWLEITTSTVYPGTLFNIKYWKILWCCYILKPLWLNYYKVGWSCLMERSDALHSLISIYMFIGHIT